VEAVTIFSSYVFPTEAGPALTVVVSGIGGLPGGSEYEFATFASRYDAEQAVRPGRTRAERRKKPRNAADPPKAGRGYVNFERASIGAVLVWVERRTST
jgi:hypothetical protein